MIPIDNKNKISDIDHKERQRRILEKKKRNKLRELAYKNMITKKYSH